MTKTKMILVAMALGASAVLPMQAQADQWAPANIQATVKGMKATASKMASANPVKAVPVAGKGDAVDSLILRLDALNHELNRQVVVVIEDLIPTWRARCQDNPEVSSERGLECLNMENQFLQDYGKYVTRVRALKLFTAAILGTGDAREPGIYQSLDLTQALKIRNRLAAGIFAIYGDNNNFPWWARQFHINGAGSEQLGGDIAKLGALADEQERDVNFIIDRYMTVVCGRKNSALLASTAAPWGCPIKIQFIARKT